MARFDCRCIASWACFSNKLQGADAGILILRNGKNAQPHSLSQASCDLEDLVRQPALRQVWRRLGLLFIIIININGVLVGYKLK